MDAELNQTKNSRKLARIVLPIYGQAAMQWRIGVEAERCIAELPIKLVENKVGGKPRVCDSMG